MACVVKKGNLDVKRKNKIGPAYKRKFVVLRRDLSEGTKVVDVYDSENCDGDRECLQLNGIWSVQDRESQNKKRFAFELVIGANVVMSFSCPSLLERGEWTESFRILNSISSSSPVPPVEDMYHVILEHNVYSAEIGMSGPCLLRVQDSSVVLYSEDGSRKLHHWAFDIIENISMAGDQVILDVHRPGNIDSLMQFKFNTDFDSSRNILIACSMTMDNKHKTKSSSLSLNNVGLSVSPAETPTKTQSLSRSFLGSVKPSKPSVGKEEKGVRRAKSFTDKSSFSVRRSISPDVGRNMGSIHSITSQESYAVNRPLSQSKDEEGSPPPIPPRAPRRPPSIGLDTINLIDPDYHYIKDDTIDGGGSGNRSSTNNGGGETLDQQLDDLLRDIVAENRVKERNKTPTHTLGSNVISPYAETGRRAMSHQNTAKVTEDLEKKKVAFFQEYGDKAASDYLDPVPSKSVQEKKNSIPSHSSRDWGRANGVVSKRHSSGEFTSSSSIFHSQSSSNSSSHDYHTIPDKPSTTANTTTTPHHGHSSSMDSTHADSSVSERRSWLRTHSGSDEPPSPPLPPRPSYLTQIPPNSPTKQHYMSTSSTSTNPQSLRKSDISPYAVTKGIVLDSTTTTQAPPLPPRSPSKHQRDRVSSHSHNNRCQKCNGIKMAPTRSSSSVRQQTQPHRLPPSPPLDGSSQQRTVHKEKSLSPTKPRPKSQPALGGSGGTDKGDNTSAFGNEIDTALAMLDDCVKGLTILDVDPTTMAATDVMETSPKTSSMSIQTDIDQAIKSIQEASNNLSQQHPPTRPVNPLYSNSSQMRQLEFSTPYVPPRSQVSLTQGGTQPTPKKYHLSQQYTGTWYGTGSNGTPRVNDHHLPLSRFHSSNEIPSNTVRAQDIHYN